MRDKLTYEWGIPIAISLLAVGARYCINADRASLTGIIRAAIIGIFVGMEVNLYLLDGAVVSQELRGAIVGVAAALAHEVFLLVILMFKAASKDPKAALANLINQCGSCFCISCSSIQYHFISRYRNITLRATFNPLP